MVYYLGKDCFSEKWVKNPLFHLLALVIEKDVLYGWAK